MNEAAGELFSPDRYPVAFDLATKQTRFLLLNEAAYAAASFLDERLIDDDAAPDWRAWQALAPDIQLMAGECDFIFHVGHVGSTLLSRLLGRSRRVFSVREPAILRRLAGIETETGETDELRTTTRSFLRLLARVYRTEQRSLVKATSFVSELGRMLLDLQPGAKAILMVSPPAAHIAGILAGEASREELAINAPDRLTRLHRRIGSTPWRLEGLRTGEIAAMSWLCEVHALDAIATRFGERVQWLDFDTLLAEPARGLDLCLRHLHGASDKGEVETMLAGPDLRRYSKAPEFSFNPALRRRVVDQAFNDHRSDIELGLAWLNSAASIQPELGQVMRRTAKAIRAD